MFIALSKTLDLFLSPLGWALILLLASLALWRRRRAARALLAAAASLLYLASAGAVANGLVALVEEPAERTWRPEVTYDAVIVLAGAVDAAASRASGELEFGAAADRVTRAFELLREGRARDALLTGGLVFPIPGEAGESSQVAALLERWGVPRQRLVVEDGSRNTHQNAVESAKIVTQRGWRTLLLVTSAAHMPRALGCFHAAGLAPDALPVDRRAGGSRGPSGWIPRAEALAASTDALRELAGRVVYRVMGYTQASAAPPAGVSRR